MYSCLDATPYKPILPSARVIGTFHNFTGQRFNRLLVMALYGRRKRAALWLCRCDCGRYTLQISVSLTKNRTKSCGCLSPDQARITHTKHGHARKGMVTSEYRIYQAAKDRCENTHNVNYAYYGGRGIEFRFASYPDFFAALGKRPSDSYSIDRFPDVNGHYEKGNVRWATKQEQTNNRRNTKYFTIKDQTKTLSEWAKIYNIPYRTLLTRFHNPRRSNDETLFQCNIRTSPAPK